MKLSIKIGIGCCVTLLIIIIFGWGIFPAMIKHMLKKTAVLKPGGEIRKMWTKVPFPVDFNVYIFNVTNSRDVHANGDSPVLDEIGPFAFEEWKEKINLVDNDADDTVSYNPVTRFVFNPIKSGKLTMNEIVTIPHPMMTSMLLAVNREKPSMMSLVGKAVKEIFDNPESIFITARVRDILFDGLLVNCSVSSFGAKAVCSNIKAKSEELDKLSDNEFLFSLFGVKNKSIEPRLKVKRGMKNSYDVGRVVEWQNRSEMNVWSTNKCNQYRGTDSTIFPALLKKSDGLWSFAPDLCRSLGAYYVEDTTYQGLDVWMYTADFGDMSTNEDEKCFCPSNTTCLKKGVMDLFKCSGAPIIASTPHFYDCHTSYLEGVRGLHPDFEKHAIILLFEHMTGSPVFGRKRLQFNLPVQRIPKVDFMTNLPDVLLPMFWVEEAVSLEEEFTHQIDSKLFRPIKIVNVIRWVIVAITLLGLCLSALMYYYKAKSLAVATVTPLKIPQTIQSTFNGGMTKEEPKRTSIISTISNNKSLESNY